jgi:hypothetical protein
MVLWDIDTIRQRFLCLSVSNRPLKSAKTVKMSKFSGKKSNSIFHILHYGKSTVKPVTNSGRC